ncbi:MAG: BtpA/SgcQ family protein [Patescibacteria group bacterium]|nr:BtpA/SgcQ family protein [Patescibacteria group bacterium]
MVHFPPLLGYKNFPEVNVCLKKALRDAKTLEKGGVDAIMVENNYDIPHKIFVGPETVATMTFLISKIKNEIKIPLGICVLWNDYKTALSIAKICNCQFIRVPVFVDSVKTDYGRIMVNPEDVLKFRKNIGALDVALLTDIHVKHAEMLEQKTITQSVREAKQNGSDGLIITGKWTGDMPNLDELKEARGVAGDDFPIFVGSGATKENVKTLLRYANGVIVATSLKSGAKRSKKTEVNLKPWQAKIDLVKTKGFVKAIIQKKKCAK